jgi:hypothetical protein
LAVLEQISVGFLHFVLPYLAQPTKINKFTLILCQESQCFLLLASFEAVIYFGPTLQVVLHCARRIRMTTAPSQTQNRNLGETRAFLNIYGHIEFVTKCHACASHYVFPSWCSSIRFVRYFRMDRAVGNERIVPDIL